MNKKLGISVLFLILAAVFAFDEVPSSDLLKRLISGYCQQQQRKVPFWSLESLDTKEHGHGFFGINAMPTITGDSHLTNVCLR